MTTIDRSLLNDGFPGSTWGNLGLWTDARNYPSACEALAIKLAQTAQLQPGCSVLDVGFGYGDQLLLWKQRFGVGAITGIEIDAAGVAAARRKLTGHADVSLHHGTNFTPSAPARYDRVLALDCAYHFAPRSAFLQVARTSLQPGGRIALTDIVLADGARAAVTAPLARLCGIPAANLLTLSAYRQALSGLGFSHITVELLDEDVLTGFAKFAARLLRQRARAAVSAGGLRVLATAAMALGLQRSRQVHYVLVSASATLRADATALSSSGIPGIA